MFHHTNFSNEEKEAKELDAILNMFTPQSWIKEVSEAEMSICYKQADRGMIEVLSRESRKIKLTDKGADFRARGGFVTEWNNDRLKATYRWTVIAAIAAIIGALIQAYQVWLQPHIQ